MNRLQRVQELQEATVDYVTKEKKRIENEVSVLQAVLDGRTGGAGVQLPSKEQVKAVAYASLNDYLRGK